MTVPQQSLAGIRAWMNQQCRVRVGGVHNRNEKPRALLQVNDP